MLSLYVDLRSLWLRRSNVLTRLGIVLDEVRLAPEVEVAAAGFGFESLGIRRTGTSFGACDVTAALGVVILLGQLKKRFLKLLI